jgi:hypothetical protein
VTDSRYYKGLAAIAKRLSVSTNAVLRLQRDFALPIYREMTGSAGPQWRWVISEALIREWELWRARCDRAYVALLEAWQVDPTSKADPYGRRHYLATMQRYREILRQQELSLDSPPQTVDSES